MKNLLSLYGNRKPQSGVPGVVFLAVFTLAAAFIIGCDKDTPLGVDNQAGPGKLNSAAKNGGEIFSNNSLSREIRVVDRRASKGDTVKVPIQLAAQGDENGFKFSLTFDPAILHAPAIELGKDARTAVLSSDTSQIASGRLGVTLVLPAGKTVELDTRELLLASFAIDSNTTASSTRLDFCNYPTPQSVTDTSAKVLPTVWKGGTVRFGPIICAATELQNQLTKQSLNKGGAKVELAAMRQFRDGFLQRYEEGNTYVAMYYAFSKHLKTDPASLRECAAALPHLYRAMSALESGAGNEAIVTPELHRSMTAILARHRDVNDAGLQKIIARLESDLNAFHGMPKNQVISRLTPAQAKAVNSERSTNSL